MLWRYIKAQAWVLLCGGLVGPIFLAVYFATGQSGLLKWMFWVGLPITAADILIALAWPTTARSRPPRRRCSSSRASWRWHRSPGSPRRVPGSMTSPW